MFTRWLERASQGGKLMAKIEAITETQLAKISALKNEKKTLININGNKIKWTESKQYELDKLIDLRDAEDSLPKGAITHLDDTFRHLFWKRKRILINKFLTKGLFQEDEAVGLVSLFDNEFYVKNEIHFENSFSCGTPDIVHDDKVIDTKCNYDLESYENAEITALYEWQLKIYIWLTGRKYGELAYCLVNNPISQINNERTRQFYAHGCPDSDDEDWKEVCRLIERNMVFDIPLFKKQNPNYTFENEILDFSIPVEFRVKKFRVELSEKDIIDFKSRVILSRKYLLNKEIETKERLKTIKK